MKQVQILGSGCTKCEKLTENVTKAFNDLQIEYSIEKVSDLQKIMGYGVMLTPAIVIDNQVISSGKLLSVDEIKKIISNG